MTDPTRTCPPPTSHDELQIGDLVVYQTEHMPSEVQSRIVAIDGVGIKLANRDEILHSAYVRRICQDTAPATTPAAATAPTPPTAPPAEAAPDPDPPPRASRAPIEAKPCDHCGETFTPRVPNQRFCSRTCCNRFHASEQWKRRKAATEASGTETQERTCEKCGKAFTPRMHKQRFCTPQCSRKWHRIEWRKRAREKAQESRETDAAPILPDAPADGAPATGSVAERLAWRLAAFVTELDGANDRLRELEPKAEQVIALLEA